MIQVQVLFTLKDTMMFQGPSRSQLGQKPL